MHFLPAQFLQRSFPFAGVVRAQMATSLGCALLLAACAGPGHVAQTDSPDQVCLNLKLTGTNIPKKFCRTAAEWESLAAEDRAISEEYFRQTQMRSGILENASANPFE